MVREFRAAEQQHMGHTRLRDSDVLKALVFILRMGLARTSGRPKSRAFYDFLFAQFPKNSPALARPRRDRQPDRHSVVIESAALEVRGLPTLDS